MSIDEAPEGTERYEPPYVEQLPAEDGPAVTAAGDSPTPGPEWRPESETDDD